MTKISNVLAILASVFISSAAFAANQDVDSARQDGYNLLRSAAAQQKQTQDEQSTMINVHTAAIKELNQKVVANNATTSTSNLPAPPASANVAPPASTASKIDYTRYDRIARDCALIWTPNPATKDEDSTKYNGKTEAEIALMSQRCLRKQDEVSAQKQEEERRKRQPAQQMAAPAAPAAMQDGNEQEVVVGASENDANANVAPTQAGYRPADARRDNYAEVRNFLRTYKGPLWQTQGPIVNRYVDRAPPQNAVPCRPPGYNHTVLCVPRRM